ncbi:hypothetical protein LN650_21535 [Klebsiella pneumoniae subsp. pneumoniae]|nr:hypothetical protein [Klebsiella pneumoniae subsp. pneumoniae]
MTSWTPQLSRVAEARADGRCGHRHYVREGGISRRSPGSRSTAILGATASGSHPDAPRRR